MPDHELTPAQRQVLQALIAVHEQDRAPSAQAVALEAGGEPSPVRDALNELHELGLVDASLHPTPEGRQAARR